MDVLKLPGYELWTNFVSMFNAIPSRDVTVALILLTCVGGADLSK